MHNLVPPAGTIPASATKPLVQQPTQSSEHGDAAADAVEQRAGGRLAELLAPL